MSLSSIFEARKREQDKAFRKANSSTNTSKYHQSQSHLQPQPSVQSKPIFDIKAKTIVPIPPKPVILSKEQEQKKKQQHQKQLKQNLEATIFVGNVHLSTKHRQLQKLFEGYGRIEKVWFRSLPVEPNKMGRKASHILKNYIDGADSMNAYIRFANKNAALSACKQNGTAFKNMNIRVTLCESKQQDTESTVFVGNLSHNITEQQLRDHFKAIGKIESVRVIRSRQTNKGIGIGYVKYATKQEMKQAIAKLNGSKLLERQLRIKKAVQKGRLQKKAKKIETKYGKKPQDSNKNKNAKAVQSRQRSKEIRQNRKISMKHKKIKK